MVQQRHRRRPRQVADLHSHLPGPCRAGPLRLHATAAAPLLVLVLPVLCALHPRHEVLPCWALQGGRRALADVYTPDADAARGGVFDVHEAGVGAEPAKHGRRAVRPWWQEGGFGNLRQAARQPAGGAGFLAR